jgi:hypothetical protein
MKNKFQIRICSDLDYEEMVADVCYEERTIATVTQENGIDKMEIEICSEGAKIWKFSLDEYVAAIISAKQTLIEMQKPKEEPDKGS